MTPDFDAYQAGREQGVRQFCRPDKGYALGRRGGAYTGVCPEDLESAFLAGYDDGREIHGLEFEALALAGNIARIDRRIDKAEDQVAAHERLLDGGDGDKVDATERKTLRAEIRDLVETITNLQRDRTLLLRELGARQETLRALLAAHAHYRT